jgi:hypothetical protein
MYRYVRPPTIENSAHFCSPLGTVLSIRTCRYLLQLCQPAIVQLLIRWVNLSVPHCSQFVKAAEIQPWRIGVSAFIQIGGGEHGVLLRSAAGRWTSTGENSCRGFSCPNRSGPHDDRKGDSGCRDAGDIGYWGVEPTNSSPLPHTCEGEQTTVAQTDVEGTELQIPTVIAFPLGFIACELITNSIKCAKGRN